jgi:hypothetical protein
MPISMYRADSGRRSVRGSYLLCAYELRILNNASAADSGFNAFLAQLQEPGKFSGSFLERYDGR